MGMTDKMNELINRFYRDSNNPAQREGDYETGETVKVDMGYDGTVEGRIQAIIEVDGRGTFYQVMIDPSEKPGFVQFVVTADWLV